MTDAATADFLPILSAAASPARWLVVSLHDVAPHTQTRMEEILRELTASGIKCTSLLVVPDYHRTGKAVESTSFISWLRGLEAEGHEIVIHGYFHQRSRRNGEGLSTKIVTRFYTRDEGEFFDIGYDDALERITRARDEFRAAHLAPLGFIAPAWLLSTGAQRAANEAGMQYTARIGSVIDLMTGEAEPARSLVYSTRAPWRCSASLVWNAALARAADVRPLVRLSVHPGDFEVREIRRQIVRLARRFVGTRTVTTYRDWIAERRIAP
ncbi:MAG: polysaccharide deacetylase family protein [Verrucomicrobia bacterium]|nr:polysaccharide deacetylase family protein [Verrucomicrobiota bacterium]